MPRDDFSPIPPPSAALYLMTEEAVYPGVRMRRSGRRPAGMMTTATVGKIRESVESGSRLRTGMLGALMTNAASGEADREMALQAVP